MKTYSNQEKLTSFLGVVLICGILYTFWLIISFFVNILSAIDPKISATIIGAMITAFVGLGATMITQQQIRLRETHKNISYRPR